MLGSLLSATVILVRNRRWVSSFRLWALRGVFRVVDSLELVSMIGTLFYAAKLLGAHAKLDGRAVLDSSTSAVLVLWKACPAEGAATLVVGYVSMLSISVCADVVILVVVAVADRAIAPLTLVSRRVAVLGNVHGAVMDRRPDVSCCVVVSYRLVVGVFVFVADRDEVGLAVMEHLLITLLVARRMYGLKI